MAKEAFDPNKYIDTPTYAGMSGQFTREQVLAIADVRMRRQAEIQSRERPAIQSDRADAVGLFRGLELGGMSDERASIRPPKIGEMSAPSPELGTTPVTIGEQILDISLSGDRRTDISKGTPEDPHKLQIFQDFIANLNTTDPRISSIADLGKVQKIIAEMTKKPEYHAQFNEAVNRLFGKTLRIDSGSIKDTGFAWLSFRGTDGQESKNFSLGMDSSSVLVKKNWFSPDEYKAVGTYYLSEYALGSESPEKYKAELRDIVSAQSSGGPNYYENPINRIKFLDTTLRSIGVNIDIGDTPSLRAQQTRLVGALTPDILTRMKGVPEIVTCMKGPNNLYQYVDTPGGRNDAILAMKLSSIMIPHTS